MKWAALIVWVITALGGFGLLGIWLQRGGARQADQPGRRIRPPLIFTHLALAASGLIVWIIYLATGTRPLAWIAFAVLLVVASLGFGMFALWLQRRQASTTLTGTGGAGTVALDAGVPAGQNFPVPIVLGHGLVAATTLVLVLLAALRVGGS